MTMESTEPIIKAALSANISALYIRLRDATMRTADARQAMDAGNQNLAIGTLLDFEDLLPEMQQLFSTIMLLHKNSER